MKTCVHLVAAILLCALTSRAPGQNNLYSYDSSGNIVAASPGGTGLPQIIGQPVGRIAGPGDVVTFSVVLGNPAGAAFQWRLNNSPIPGATGDSLVVTANSAASEGNYSVAVTNGAGTVSSGNAFLGWDGDGNGLPDSWRWPTSATSNQTATGDYDGDGVSNLDEYLNGTDPADASSYRPRLNLVVHGPGSVTVSPAQANYALGQIVTLTAVPAAGSSFDGWRGGLVGPGNQQTLTMNATKTVMATFGSSPPPGLVGWWKAENNALDATGSNNGTLINGTGFGSGEVGQAFVINGSNQSVDIPDAPALRPASVTVESWVMFNSTGGGPTIIAKGVGGGSLDSYIIWFQDGQIRGGVSSGYLGAVFTPTLGVWYHVACTFDDSSRQIVLYLNGSAVATGTASGPISYDATPVTLGRDTDSGGPAYFLNGRVDEAAIYNRALGADEVAAIYGAGSTGKNALHPDFTTPSQLPEAIVGTGYAQTVGTVLGTPPITYTLFEGTCAPGLSLSTAGLLSGTPSQPGFYEFGILATAATGLSTELVCDLKVSQAVVPPPGMIAWWRAEADPGTVKDSVGGHDGAYYEGSTPVAPVYAQGKVGSALAFDGSANVRVPDSPALRPAQLTVEAWVYPTVASAGNWQCIAAKGFSSNNTDTWYLGLFDGRPRISYLTAGTPYVYYDAPDRLPLNRWTHLAFTFDGYTKALYVNGTLASSSSGDGALIYDTASVPLTIGSDWNGGPTDIFNGLIDEVSIYNRALTESELTAVANAGAAGKYAGLYVTSSAQLATGYTGQGYSQTFTSVLGTGAVTYSLFSGALPGGLALSGGRVLSGTPSAAGTFAFTVKATDSANTTVYQLCSLQIIEPLPVPASMVAWWKAENNALDSFGVNHGTLVNGAGFDSGVVGQAFSLNGSNQSIDIPDAPALRPASVTMEAWVMLNSTGGTQMVFSKAVGGGTLDSYVLFFQGGNLSGGVDSGTVSVPFSPVAGTWHHVACTFDDPSRQIVLYLDGSPFGSGQASHAIAYDGTSMALGRDTENGSPAFFLNGRIDEAALYSRALTPKEIAAIYNSGLAGKRAWTPIEQWKYTYFGDINAPDSGDPDGDGQTNLFEYVAGLVPTDSTSRFKVRIESVPEQAGRMNVIFSPCLSDRTYTVTSRSNLSAGAWTPLSNIVTSDNGLERTVTDLDASGPKFYRVEITKP